MPKQVIEQEKNWYVIHTYSGYEDAVAKNLKQRIESLGMEDKIFNVIVPKEKKIKIKNGPFKGFEGKVSEIDRERGKIKVLVNMFGRDTPVELDSLQIKKL